MKNEKKQKPGSRSTSRENLKIKRQLLIYHLHLIGMRLSYEVICEFFRENAPQKEFHLLSRRTFERDIRELKEAGLFHSPRKNSNNKARNMHLDKLSRLAVMMQEVEDVCDDSKNIYSWYKKRFPSYSERTMYRDFSILSDIGYRTYYYSGEKQYDASFPYDYSVSIK